MQWMQAKLDGVPKFSTQMLSTNTEGKLLI